MIEQDEDDLITTSFKKSLDLTKSIFSQAIKNGNRLINLKEEKMNESQLLLDAASSLHSAANRFISLSDEFNENRDKSLIEQLCETNTKLENAFVALNDHLAASTSSKSVTVKKLLSVSAPFLPLAMYFCFDKMKEKPVDTEAPPPKLPDDEESSKIYFSIS